MRGLFKVIECTGTGAWIVQWLDKQTNCGIQEVSSFLFSPRPSSPTCQSTPPTFNSSMQLTGHPQPAKNKDYASSTSTLSGLITQHHHGHTNQLPSPNLSAPTINCYPIPSCCPCLGFVCCNSQECGQALLSCIPCCWHSTTPIVSSSSQPYLYPATQLTVLLYLRNILCPLLPPPPSQQISDQPMCTMVAPMASMYTCQWHHHLWQLYSPLAITTTQSTKNVLHWPESINLTKQAVALVENPSILPHQPLAFYSMSRQYLGHPCPPLQCNWSDTTIPCKR